LLAAMVVTAALGLVRVQATTFDSAAGRGEDPALYAAIVHEMRAGASYYDVMGMELRARGYAVDSPFNHRLPTLAVLMATLPSDGYARGLLMIIGCATLVLWLLALRPQAGALATFVALVMLAGLVMWTAVGRAFLVHETWAGVAIALSMALFAMGRGVAGMLVALLALSLRELALPYLLISLVFAFRGGKRTELYLGLVGLLGFLVGYGAHLARLHTGIGFQSAQPWLVGGGLGFLLKTLRMNLWLLAGPTWLTALALPLCLLGLSALPNPLGGRVRVTVYLFAAFFLMAGMPYNHLWGLLIAGPAMVGLAFAPRALADLWRRSFPRSRAAV
jgi:hypothetical protein